MEHPTACLEQVIFSDNPQKGDAQETGLIGRQNSSESFDEDRAHLASKAVPVTPGVHTAGHSAYFEAKREAGEADQQHVHYDDVSPGPNWNANTYHAPKNEEASDASPGLAATDAKSAEEAIRKLNMAGSADAAKKDLTDVDPRAAHPGLGLSGHIISATFVVPYSIGFAPDKEWVSLSNSV
jgi:trehalose 6-phosphate synthase/phosphatase